MSEENDKRRYLYIGGDVVCTFLTIGKIYKYISNMGNNLPPHSIAVGCENIYFLTPYFKFIIKEKINDDNSFESYDYLVSKRGRDSFKKLITHKIRSN